MKIALLNQWGKLVEVVEISRSTFFGQNESTWGNEENWMFGYVNKVSRALQMHERLPH
jgi:hypothetical protein